MSLPSVAYFGAIGLLLLGRVDLLVVLLVALQVLDAEPLVLILERTGLVENLHLPRTPFQESNSQSCGYDRPSRASQFRQGVICMF